MINLARNIGGSCGIAFVTTLLARRTQVHQNVLATPDAAESRVCAGGRGPAGGPDPAGPTLPSALPGPGHDTGELVRQSSIVAYADVFQLLGIISLAVIPFMFLFEEDQARPRGHAGHALIATRLCLWRQSLVVPIVLHFLQDFLAIVVAPYL